MTKELYIELIYKNLKGEITNDEFNQLNLHTATHPSDAQLRLEIEDAWDLTGEIPLLVNSDETDQLFKKVQESTSSESTIQPINSKKSNSKEKDKSIFRRLIPAISGVAAILILGIIGMWMFRGGEVVYDQPGVYTLADQSEVILRSGELRIQEFEKSSRKVALAGEAFFRIAKDKSRPFSVKTSIVEVEVLGTEFLIKEQTDSLFIELVEGSVKTTDLRSNAFKILKPGMVVLHTKDGLIEIKNGFQNLTSWSTGVYQFKDQTLESVVQELEIIYGTDISIEKLSMKACEITALIQSKDLDEILNRISDSFGINVIKNQDNRILQGGKCR